MTHRTDVARGQEIVARWCNLAEQRLEHLTELFDTGRWRRYHSEQAFLENIREARAAVDIWRELLTREASLDNSPIDLSWLGRGRSKLPPPHISPPPERRPEAAVLAEAAIKAVAAALETAAEVLEQPPTVADAPPLEMPPVMPPPVLDLDTIQRRYPLLRNTL
ncbi:putative repeat protein (TIGR03809 family) [Bradyrhizobium sp. USDA 4524]|uniref:TIGR03809 family protein n=1 Tax=unclassified Bradyrhizobium TaxID=2631580 RepID=UPI00209E29D7|nr:MULTISPECIES: TIGR03809 family protein [unclassified Bradyrhizobium]MCP1837493.1 putative repeat protein (TIGR03809 family) [Bradyrhizobium sp. USDA 4538]MCP1906511.1 putative repeat protein (TIGR03809 family) [Bradyrhizobium sp. USDA 4537]MCP1987833.1 putative repeat protein (TIGR03809 family) [Bradyrhizobium sp. USDA 4539]